MSSQIKASVEIKAEASAALKVVRELREELAKLKKVEAGDAAAKPSKSADKERVAALRERINYLKAENGYLNERVAISRKAYEAEKKRADAEEAAAIKREKRAANDVHSSAKAYEKEQTSLEAARTRAEQRAQQRAEAVRLREARLADLSQKAELAKESKKFAELERLNSAYQKEQEKLTRTRLRNEEAQRSAAIRREKQDFETFQRSAQAYEREKAALQAREIAREARTFRELDRTRRLYEAEQLRMGARQSATDSVGQATAARRQTQLDYYRTIRSPFATTGAIQGLLGQADMLTASQVSGLERMLKSRQMLNRFAEYGKSSAKSFLGGFSSFLGSGVGAALTAAGLTALGKSVFQQSSALQTLRLQLKGVYGDAETAKKQYDELIKKSQQYGVDPTKFGGTYARFAAGAKGAGFSNDEINSGVDALFQTKTALGLTPERLEMTSKALSDMLAKGTVQAEELKGQLADHIPNAVQLAARAAGVSTKELFAKMKDGAVDSTAFVKLLLIELRKEYGKTAEEAQKSPMVAVSQLQTQMKLAADEIGNGGFNEAIAKVARDVTAELSKPEAKENLKAIGKAMGEMVLWLYDGAKAVAGWVKDNKDWLTSLAKVAGVLLAIKVGFGLLAAVLTPITVPLSLMSKMLGWTIPGAAATAGAAIRSFALAASIQLNTLGGSIAGIARSLGALGIGVAAAYGIYEARESKKSAQSSYTAVTEGDLSKLSDEDLARHKQTLTERQGSWGVKAGSFLGGGQGAQVDEALGAVANEELRRKGVARIDERNKAETAREEARMRSKAEENQQAALRAGLFTPGESKGKGQSALRSAEFELANQRFANSEAELKDKLARNQVSIKNYFEQLGSLRTQQYEAKVKALNDELAGEEKNADEKKAIETRKTALAEQRSKELKDLSRERFEAEKEQAEKLATLQAELEDKTQAGTEARMAQIDSKWADTLAKMKAEGNRAGVELVEKLINLEKADVRLNELRRKFELATGRGEVNSAQIELDVASGRMTSYQGQDALMEQGKSLARQRIELLTEELKLTEGVAGAEMRRYELQKQILEEKKKLTEQSRLDKAVMEAGTSYLESTLLNIMQGKGGSFKSILKGFISSITGAMQKTVADELAQLLMNSLQQASAQSSGGGGGSSLLSGLFKTGLNWLMGNFGGGGFSAPAGAGPGSMSVVPGMSDMGSVFEGAVSRGLSVSGASAGGMSMGGASVVMNISTPDANSFRASSGQMNFDMQNGFARAAQRNG